MHLTPGTRLGPYEIESLIGSGGMGEVYKAHDGRLNRTVAIKRLIADNASQFQSEARAIAAINHPHICQIYDVGPDYLVLEYLQGEPISGPMARTASRIASAWMIEARRVFAPAWTFVAERAITLVIGIPPNNGVTRFPSPCPMSS